VTERLTLAFSTLLLAAIALLPIASILSETVTADGAFNLRAYHVLLTSEARLVLLMGHSLQLSLLTASIATLIGVPLGILLGKTDLPLRGSLTLLLTAPLLIPPYVLAVAWFSILGRTGVLGGILPDAWSQKISSEFFGLWGCTFMLASAFMPIAMLLTITFLRTVNPQLENAARLISRWSSVLFRITLPLVLPAIAFAAVLIFLLSFGEIGVPMYLRFAVYPTEILTQFAAFYDFRTATVAAVPLLVVTLVILGLQAGLHQRVLQLGRRTASEETVQISLGPWRFPLLALVAAFAIVVVGSPLGALLAESWSLATYQVALTRAGDSVIRSLAFAAAGATALAVLGFFWGYLTERRTLSFWWTNEWLAFLLLALPGSVIGIGLISVWNTAATNFIYASPVILILGYLTQYAILPMRVVSASLAAVPRSLEEAAWLSGAGWFITLRRIVAPLASRGLLAAWLISYVFSLRDVAMSIVVYPPGYDTLPVRILTLMANGAPSLIAALCIILIAITIVPLGAAGLWFKFAQTDHEQH
jgi:iron(III) transport system permease protein